MKIMNEKKTHFMKKSKCGLYLVKYDTVENVHHLINSILDMGNKKMLNNKGYKLSRRELT